MGSLLILPIAPPPELTLIAVSNYVWVPDEVGAMHSFGVISGIWDEVTGVSPPQQVSEFNGISIGSALVILGDDSQYHRFQIAGVNGEWTDMEQTPGPPFNQRSVADILLPNGLLIQSASDGLIHLMKVVTGRWTDTGVPSAPGGGVGGGGHPGPPS